MDFMKEHAGESIMSCLFQSKDTTDRRPCAVMSVAVKDEAQAERYLQHLLYVTPKREDARQCRGPLPVTGNIRRRGNTGSTCYPGILC